MERMKRTFKMKQKALFVIFKALSMKQIKPTFLEVESWTLKLEIIKMNIICDRQSVLSQFLHKTSKYNVCKHKREEKNRLTFL